VLDNCQRESRGNLRVETLSPETNLETIRKLIDSHKQEFSMIRGGGLVMGLLVTYGEKEQQAAYIRYTDLESFESDPQTGRTTGRSFLGEVKLVEQLLNLSEAGNRPVVYLLQGHEELELTDSAPASERGAGLFQQRLARRGNLTVKPLTFPQSNAKVPDDASVLVILAPKVPLLQDHVRAVGQYLNERQGKVLVLFDVRPAPGGTGMAMTGLEDLLRTYNVDVTNERILTMTEVVPGIGAMYPPESELSLAVIDSAMRSSLNPLAGLVRQARLIKVANCRVVRGTAFRSNLKAEQLLATPANLPCWTDTTPGVDTHRADAAMHGDEKYFTEHAKASLPMAVLVSEASEPVSPMQPPVAGKPRLAVFGSTTFAVNPAMNPAAPSIYYDLMVGSIDWLREKPAGIGVQAKTNRAFVLNPATTDWKALYLLPLGVMLLGVIGLGGGVWVARRR
jgi:hypothetical protein